MLNNAFRSVRAPPHPSFFSYNNSHLANHINRKPNSSTIRFSQAVAGPNSNNNNNSEEMNQQKKEPESKTGDSMSSFGEAYATRSDEEGFGGIYGGNQYLHKQDNNDDEDETVRGKDPEFDHSQGSEVKEKEKARNQEKVAS